MSVEPAWTAMSLFGDEEPQYTRDEVLTIDPRQHQNGQRVADLARLGYLPEPVLDPTYGYGSMWSEYKPQMLYGGDADPRKVPVIGRDVFWSCTMDFTALPFDDDLFGSVLYDPPYRFAGTPTETHEGGHDDLYGTHVYRTKAEQMALILGGAAECARVAREFLIVKCQDQVVAGSVRWQSIEIMDAVEAMGWRLKDRLGLLSYRAQPAGRRQRNSRQNVSWFLVFVPDGQLDTRGRERSSTA